MLISYPYVKRLFCFLLFLSGGLAMSGCACSNSSSVIGDLLLPRASEAAAAAAGVSGVLLNAGECDVSALAKSDEAKSDDSFCRFCFCGLAPRGAEILFTCHGQADQIRIGIGISCPRLIGDRIAQEISKYFPTPNMLNRSRLRMLDLRVSLIENIYRLRSNEDKRRHAIL